MRLAAWDKRVVSFLSYILKRDGVLKPHVLALTRIYPQEETLPWSDKMRYYFKKLEYRNSQ